MYKYSKPSNPRGTCFFGLFLYLRNRKKVMNIGGEGREDMLGVG